MSASAPRFLSRYCSPFLAALVACLTLAIPLAARADEGLDVRLGQDVLPTFQRVRLKLDPDKRTYAGVVHVDLKIVNATDSVRSMPRGRSGARVTLHQGSDSISVAL
jgi:hypothetical protein